MSGIACRLGSRLFTELHGDTDGVGHWAVARIGSLGIIAGQGGTMGKRVLTILSVMVAFVGAVPAAAGSPSGETSELFVWMVEDGVTGDNFAFVYDGNDGLVGDTTLLAATAPRRSSIDWDGDPVPARPLRVRMRLQTAAEADWVIRGVDIAWAIAPHPEDSELDTLCADGTVRWRIKNAEQLQTKLVERGFREIKERGRGTLRLCLTPGSAGLATSADFYADLPYKNPSPS